jgi:hypothetical protein
MPDNGKKTATKTARPSPRSGVALPLGNHPGNTGGKPGRSGRPPKAFKKFCRELAKSGEFQKALEAAATDAEHQNYIGAAKLVATFATAKPAKTVNHNHRHFADPRAALADRLARIIDRN